MSQAVFHALALLATVCLSFLVSKTGLAQYDLQLGALAFLILFVGRRLLPVRSHLFESLLFTFIITLIVYGSGGAASPFFFLIYFLLFALALLLEPIISITTTLSLIVVFLLTLPDNQSLTALLPVFSLAFLTPFALFLGQEYLEVRREKRKTQRLETQLAHRQEDTFLFLSLLLKNHLKNVKDAVTDFMGDHELHLIKKNVQRMEKLIEEYEKND
ncbi:hypothetical protein M1523_01380 [Patescibacteria group bacterium]|nr:hypothetical protein [Patescibacteria group bacterium]MCL5091568.1 hypothetical protein [Patescibacteria group bacterium]